MTTEDTYVGLHLTKPAEIPFDKAREGWKASIIDYIAKQGIKLVTGGPFITIPMPCGEVVEYQNFEDIPFEDVPCPCGNKNHIVVMYSTAMKINGN